MLEPRCGIPYSYSSRVITGPFGYISEFKIFIDFPSSWELCSSPVSRPQIEDADSEESDGGEEEHTESYAENPNSSQAYQEFLIFLSLGCYNSPQQGYPSVVIILSTIPSSVC
jgi:hypothetical protein